MFQQVPEGYKSMAKTSQVNRNGKRERMAARDKDKRAHAEGDDHGSHAAGGRPF